MATAVELEKTRHLIASLEDEGKALSERLTTEKATNAILNELNETPKPGK